MQTISVVGDACETGQDLVKAEETSQKTESETNEHKAPWGLRLFCLFQHRGAQNRMG